MQISMAQKQKALQNKGNKQKNRTTRAFKMEAKKVNNMPNLQSMSQAKGYGRLYKKSSQNMLCSREIDRNSFLILRKVQPTSPNLGFKLIYPSNWIRERHCSYLGE